jgi:hypothetical protein
LVVQLENSYTERNDSISGKQITWEKEKREKQNREEIVGKGKSNERTAQNKWGNAFENGKMVDQERESNRLDLLDTSYKGRK